MVILHISKIRTKNTFLKVSVSEAQLWYLQSAGLSPLAAEIMDSVGLLCTDRR